MNLKKVVLIIGVLCLLAVTFLTSSPFLVGTEPQPVSANQAESRSVDGHHLRVIIITNEDGGTSDSDIHRPPVRVRFRQTVNSGKYDIAWTKTVWHGNKMIAAEIYYRVGPSIEPLSNNLAGKGYCLRVRIITDAGGGPGSVVPSPNVIARFKKIINSGKYDIVRTRTVYRAGKMIAAEIYYQEPSCSYRVRPL